MRTVLRISHNSWENEDKRCTKLDEQDQKVIAEYPSVTNQTKSIIETTVSSYLIRIMFSMLQNQFMFILMCHFKEMQEQLEKVKKI